jgi:hypothetical protein
VDISVSRSKPCERIFTYTHFRSDLFELIPRSKKKKKKEGSSEEKEEAKAKTSLFPNTFF